MIRVSTIIKQAPGRVVEVWIGGWGGASHFGTWFVDPKRHTLIGPLEWTSPITWGEAKRRYRQENRIAMGPIVRAMQKGER